MKPVIPAIVAVILAASFPGMQLMAAPERAPGADAGTVSSHEAETEASRKALEGFISFVSKGDVEGAFANYTTKNYTQHMSGIAPGRDGAIAYIKDELARGGNTSVVGFVADGNLVGVHLRQVFTDGSPPAEVIELWRVENGKLAEHWGAKKNVQ